MGAHRFFCPFEPGAGEVVLDDKDEWHHLAHVIRLKANDPLELANGLGGLAHGHIKALGKASACISLNKVVVMPETNKITLTLACAIPRKDRFETILEKCTELGVDRIIPLVTERTQICPDTACTPHKMERYRRIVINAAKQSHRLWFPDLSSPQGFDQVLEAAANRRAKIFIPWLEGERVFLPEAIRSSGVTKEVVFFIGPEGDFTAGEVEKARASGAIAVSLGENVLKVDTAAMAVIAMARMLT